MAHLLGLGETGAVGLSPRPSPLVRRLDPRGRILAALAFAVVVTGLSSLTALVAALAAALALLAVSGLPVATTLKRMMLMDGFIVFMLVLLPFSTPGTALLVVPGGFVASAEGLRLAVEIALTANAVILALMVLVGTMEPVVLGHALARLRVPERLVHLLLFTVRYIEVLRDEYSRSRQAMQARAFRPGSNRHCWRSLGQLVGMMLVRALERSERILQAMKCRGFTGRLPLLSDLRFGRIDGLAAVLFLAGLLGLVLLEMCLADLA
ncbi:cobalt ECF transporter T component CbiQ [Pseudogemmobacter blasticus]|uniref:cobalt ECF transporter T component CbiQ n=1 Tax=Fuscovulum blasticum TaxID=1075 RepID=UPI00267CB36F